MAQFFEKGTYPTKIGKKDLKLTNITKKNNQRSGTWELFDAPETYITLRKTKCKVSMWDAKPAKDGKKAQARSVTVSLPMPEPEHEFFALLRDGRRDYAERQARKQTDINTEAWNNELPEVVVKHQRDPLEIKFDDDRNPKPLYLSCKVPTYENKKTGEMFISGAKVTGKDGKPANLQQLLSMGDIEATLVIDPMPFYRKPDGIWGDNLVLKNMAVTGGGFVEAPPEPGARRSTKRKQESSEEEEKSSKKPKGKKGKSSSSESEDSQKKAKKAKKQADEQPKKPKGKRKISDESSSEEEAKKKKKKKAKKQKDDETQEEVNELNKRKSTENLKGPKRGRSTTTKSDSDSDSEGDAKKKRKQKAESVPEEEKQTKEIVKEASSPKPKRKRAEAVEADEDDAKRLKTVEDKAAEGAMVAYADASAALDVPADTQTDIASGSDD